jgi:hypothetical protein
MPRISVDDAVALMKLEYAELPGLKLTPWQAERLWNLPHDVCQRALATLTEERVLARTVDGAYVRRTWAPSSRLPSDRPAA